MKYPGVLTGMLAAFLFANTAFAQSERIKAIADAFRVAGFPVSICANMDAWLKTHVAEIGPTAYALYMAGAAALLQGGGSCR